MKLEGVHILLTYRCLFECDHCFVWGSPRQSATLSLSGLFDVLDQTAELGGVRCGDGYLARRIRNAR